jgi:hypothetical protein
MPGRGRVTPAESKLLPTDQIGEDVLKERQLEWQLLRGWHLHSDGLKVSQTEEGGINIPR